MKLYLVQIHPEINDKCVNRDKILSYVEKGLKSGANLIAFGECALTGYDTTGLIDFRVLAETIPGPTTDVIVSLLKKRQSLVLLGMPNGAEKIFIILPH